MTTTLPAPSERADDFNSSLARLEGPQYSIRITDTCQVTVGATNQDRICRKAIHLVCDHEWKSAAGCFKCDSGCEVDDFNGVDVLSQDYGGFEEFGNPIAVSISEQSL